MRISIEKERKSQKIRRRQMLIDAISGFMTDFLRLIDVDAGGLRLKKGQGILHLTQMIFVELIMRGNAVSHYVDRLFLG